jgi:hypothetical protein
MSPAIVGQTGKLVMIWTSMRFGWGNTSAIVALALLPIVAMIGAAPRPAAQDRAKIERPCRVAAQWTLDLTLLSN